MSEVPTVRGPVDTADLGPAYIDWIDPRVMRLLPQWNYLHIHDEVLPYIRQHGVTEDQITTMLTANPRRFFENKD